MGRMPRAMTPRRATHGVHARAIAIGEAATERAEARENAILVIIEPAKAMKRPMPRVVPVRPTPISQTTKTS